MAGLVKNILVFGNLLRLPPVFEGPVYTPLTSSIVNKHTGSVGAADIWRQLFSYDELTINMKQKEHAEFIELLGRVRLGAPLASDVKSLLKQQLAKHSEDSTHTVGLENVITVKVKVAVGCKVILQHNTNVTLGLVSETIRTIRGIQ